MHEIRSNQPSTPHPFVITSRIRLEESEQAAWIDLRGDLQDADFGRRLATVFHRPVAVGVNRFLELGDRTLIWLGPDELMVIAPYKERLALITELETAMDGFHAAVTDVTGNRVRWRVSGIGARELLAAGCSIDFHPRAFASGQCAQTLFARSSATILQIADDPIYELHLRRSFGRHLRSWALQTVANLG